MFVKDPSSEEVMKLLEYYFKEHNLISCDINHLGFDNEYEIVVDATPDLQSVLALNIKPITT